MLRVLALLLPAATLSAADITTMTGKRYSGSIASVADGVIALRTDAGLINIPVKEMAAIDYGTKPPDLSNRKYDELELTDGSLLRVTAIRIPERAVEPTLLAVDGVAPPTVVLRLDSVFYWCRNAQEAKARAEWKELLSGRGKRDLYVIRDADGKLSGAPGTVLRGDAAGEMIEFERESGNLIDNHRLIRTTGGLVFNHPPRGVIPPTLCKLIDRLGNVLIVQSITISGDAVEVKTVSGAELKYPSTAALSKLDFSTGNLIYLTEMNAVESAPPAVSIVGEPVWKVVKDSWPNGTPLKMREMAYTRGLAIPPDFSLKYNLNGDFRELKAMVGIDDRYRELELGSRLIIEADGKAVYNELLKRTEKAKELTLDVKNVKSLVLRAEPESPTARPYVLLAEARVQK